MRRTIPLLLSILLLSGCTITHQTYCPQNQFAGKCDSCGRIFCMTSDTNKDANVKCPYCSREQVAFPALQRFEAHAQQENAMTSQAQGKFFGTLATGLLFGPEAINNSPSTYTSSTPSSNMTYVYSTYDGSMYGYVQDGQLISFKDGSVKGYFRDGYLFSGSSQFGVRDRHIYDNDGNPILRIGN